MTNVLAIVSIHDEQNVIAFHPEQKNGIELMKVSQGTVQFGQAICKVYYKLDPNIKINEMGISINLINSLKIPTTLEYEIRYDQHQNILKVGPCIGILASKTNGKLKRKLNVLRRYLRQYSEINGCIIVFSLEGIDFNSKKINGFMYKPDTKSWKRGIFLFPAAVLRRRISLSKEKSRAFRSAFGHCYINNKTFNKWEMYQWLSTNETVNCYLPPTLLYQHPMDLIQFISTYNCVYLKPLTGMMGRQIIKVTKKDDSYEVSTSKNKKLHLHSTNELMDYCKQSLIPNKYIIQKALDLTIIEDHMIDFRVVIIKNKVGDWEYVGSIARYGTFKGIVSNYAAGGKLYNPQQLLQLAFNISEEEASNLENQMAIVAIKAAAELEKYDIQFHKYGVDIALDINRQIWLIEMNHRYLSDSVFKLIGQPQKDMTLKLNTMLFAKYIAGFANENG
ncbi:YheC/YheD family endospore coat-associated protein [Bacillus sp. Marseille-P3661]|uniref:YheC/YheD family endospore coat-associated protein n=1 Tax=Bacillus sp. Marseille-P3661 TaxID=1936234 RepID=UPI000C822F9F|nr:YheC/YheD family protein [Bacillus sp. Marseille-P3661]